MKIGAKNILGVTTILLILLLHGLLTGQNENKYHAASLRHDNDINFSTDCYFTSGVEIHWVAPFIKKSPLNYLLLPAPKKATSYYALIITHHMYTPKKIFTPDVVPHDHPYSAYLLVGQSKTSYNPLKKNKITSSIQLGIIGPVAGGYEIQTVLHRNISIADPAEGWQNQIQNDLLLQYQAQLENAIIDLKYLELISNLRVDLGLPQTQAVVGVSMRSGWFTDYFFGPETLGIKKWQAYGFVAGDMHLVAYNAVLQGGLFNPNNKHVLNDVNPVFWHLRYGVSVVHKKLSVRYEVNVNTPTFAQALWHHWSAITIMVAF